jgi:type VI secretion system secreted protein Hcp
MASSSRRLKLLLATIVALAVAAAGAVAVASIPGGDGVITACYNNVPGSTYGTLRVIDPALQNDPGRPVPATYSCQSNESQITWNQQGPAGPTGPPGDRGEVGPAAVPSFLNFRAGGDRIYLDIGDIKGESTDDKHKGDIEIEDASLGSAPGQSTGRRTHGEIVITKKVDKSSPKLFEAAAKGRHFDTAVVTLAKKKGKGKGQQDFLVIKLQDVLVSSVRSKNPAHGAPSEQVTLNFTKLQQTYRGNGTSRVTLVPSQIAAP